MDDIRRCPDCNGTLVGYPMPRGVVLYFCCACSLQLVADDPPPAGRRTPRFTRLSGSGGAPPGG